MGHCTDNIKADENTLYLHRASVCKAFSHAVSLSLLTTILAG